MVSGAIPGEVSKQHARVFFFLIDIFGGVAGGFASVHSSCNNTIHLEIFHFLLLALFANLILPCHISL